MNNILSLLTLAKENKDPDALEKALYLENQRQFDRSHTKTFMHFTLRRLA